MKPGDPGYLGHRTGPGVKKRKRPRTLRNVKKYMKTRESWARFKKTAGMKEDIDFQTAIRRAKLHEFTGKHWINGLTDVKLSTAIDFCNTHNLDMNRFANAMIEAWQIAEQRYQVEEAIVQATAEDVLEPEADRSGGA